MCMEKKKKLATVKRVVMSWWRSETLFVEELSLREPFEIRKLPQEIVEICIR
jgi:hypothetical protein